MQSLIKNMRENCKRKGGGGNGEEKNRWKRRDFLVEAKNTVGLKLVIISVK